MKISLLTFCLTAAVTIQAQNFEWAVSMKASHINGGRCIAVDAVGNVYLTGYFFGTVDLDPGPDTLYLTAQGGHKVFVQKLDASGNLLWVNTFGEGAGNVSGRSICVDAAGNVYTTGSFTGNGDFDPGPYTANLAAVAGSTFIHKMDASGNFVWAKSYGVGSSAASLAADASGNIYTVGDFNGTADFDPSTGTANLTSAGYMDIFVQKLDASGNFIWAKSFGGNSIDQGAAISVDALGNVFTTGYFGHTADFDPNEGIVNLTAAGMDDCFVHKMDSNGNFVWVKRIGGAKNERGFDISVDVFGNIFTTGSFNETVDFNPGVGTANLISAGWDDIFVQKLDVFGKFQWARSFGGTVSRDRGHSISTDALGNVYTAGNFGGNVDFDPGMGTYNLLTSDPDYLDIFVHKMDASGNFVWVFPLKVGLGVGSGPTDYVPCIYADALGNVYTTGPFQVPVDFDPGVGTAYHYGNGIFIQKLSQDPEAIDEVSAGNIVSVFPNPTKGNFTIAAKQELGNVGLTLTDIGGRVLYTNTYSVFTNTSIDLTYPAGIYFLIVKTQESQSTFKLVKQ